MPRIAIGIAAPIRQSVAGSDLRALLDALTELDLYYMETMQPPPPRLYETTIRYKREGKRPREEWLTVLPLLKRGVGDCEDLACYRAAELQQQGEDAAAIPIRVKGGWHVVVRRESGRVEDPSARMGMLDA